MSRLSVSFGYAEPADLAFVKTGPSCAGLGGVAIDLVFG